MSEDLSELLRAAEDAVARSTTRDEHLRTLMILERVRFHIAAHDPAA